MSFFKNPKTGTTANVADLRRKVADAQMPHPSEDR
jgi:hypothetical protein